MQVFKIDQLRVLWKGMIVSVEFFWEFEEVYGECPGIFDRCVHGTVR